MTTLMNEVQGNLGNYQAMAALPSFDLFPWFFVIPGVLLAVIVALAALTPSLVVGTGPCGAGCDRRGLDRAPVVFGMFGRGPKGGQMMTAFSHIETTANVAEHPGLLRHHGRGPGSHSP